MDEVCKLYNVHKTRSVHRFSKRSMCTQVRSKNVKKKGIASVHSSK